MTSNIQDDWEVILPLRGNGGLDSEMASVHSISDSEDFAFDDQSLAESALQQDQHLVNTVPPSYAEASHEPPAEAARSAEEPTQNNDDAASIHSAGTNAEDILDIDVQPPVLLSSITSIIATLIETISSASDLNASIDNFYLPNILAESHTLFKLLSELERVVSCYADTWNAEKDADETVPLDPALYKWTSDFMISLLGLQGAIQRETEGGEENSDEFTTEIVQCLSSMIEAKEMMDNFLPIIKAYVSHLAKLSTRNPLIARHRDLNEYQTANMNFPSEPRHFHDPDALHSGPVPDLRRTLYKLKDSIYNSIQRFAELKRTSTTIVHPEIELLQAEQQSAWSTLSILLSNHGSDWIEQSLGGGLSYVEFCRLNRRTIESYTRAFDTFFRALQIRPRRCNQIILRESDVLDVRDAVTRLNGLIKARVQYNEEPESLLDVV
jgi:hypothetical protein